jgi:hypothetical protein
MVISDGSTTSDRFQTSNMKANQQVENKVIQAVTGKLSQAAGTKLAGQ